MDETNASEIVKVINMRYLEKLALKLKLAMIAIVVSAGITKAQDIRITLLECQNNALENYPQVKQRAFIWQLKDYFISKANKGYLLQL